MEDFVNRLTQLFEHFEQTASSFSDTIGVQRSSLSHLLSGRNKPSLDLIMKIHESFPEVNLYWLLKGEEPFLCDEEVKNITEKKQKETTEIPELKKTEFAQCNQSILTTEKIKEREILQPNITSDHTNTIEQIVVFYKNGTFKNFTPTR